VKAHLITARRPADVAREVEAQVRAGRRAFVLSRIANGSMLDLERLGAARYAAGVQSVVELEEETPAAVAALR
jgi:hypothetical protein